MDGKDLVERVKEDNVKFISLQFSDVTGAVKSVDMPARHLDDALKDGVWFDGSSVEGFARIQESDMRLILDPETYAVLPWSSNESRRARVFCDIFTPNGDPFEGDPRGTLKRQLKKLEERVGPTISDPSRNSSSSNAATDRVSIRSPTIPAGTLIFHPSTKRLSSAPL